MRYTVSSPMRIVKIALLVVAAGVVWFFVRYGNWFDDSAQPLEPGLVAAIRRNAHPLSTVEPAQGRLEELRFLRPLLEGKRLVAAGEATHGSHEFFAMKHRLFEFLAGEMGFTVLAVEAPYEAGLAAGRYVADGAGEPGDALRQIGDWAWNTEESLALLGWMRDYNQAQPGRPKLKFYCFDGQIPGGSRAGREERMAANVKWILDREGPQSKAFLWAGSRHIARLPGRMGDYLNRLFGSRQYSIGFEFNQGSFRSRGPAGLEMYSVEPAPPGYYAAALSRVGSLVFFVDLASMHGDEVLDRWLMRPQWSRQYDETYWFSRHFRKMNSVKAPLPDLYDAVIFSEHSWPLAPAGSRAVE
jgi:erythromycin esterase-like protein